MKNQIARESFMSAGVMPSKLLQQASHVIRDGKIIPFHVQLVPTNRCNQSCPFCNYSKRDQEQELSFEDIKRIMTWFEAAGCRAVTLTGGGEPLLHKDIKRVLFLLRGRLGLRVGMFSNGRSLGTLEATDYHNLTWVRVSLSDHTRIADIYEAVAEAVERSKFFTDWSISYVVTCNLNIKNLARAIDIASQLRLSHFQIVSDQTDLDNAPSMEHIKQQLDDYQIDDSLVLYQGKKQTTAGAKKCLISLLRPYIGADGIVYPCCATQFAQGSILRNNDPVLGMGHINELEKIWGEQRYCDGSKCTRCYFDAYNQVLHHITIKHLQHREFI